MTNVFHYDILLKILENIVVIRIGLNRLQYGLQAMNINHDRGSKTLYHGRGVDVVDIILYRDHEPRYFPVVSQMLRIPFTTDRFLHLWHNRRFSIKPQSLCMPLFNMDISNFIEIIFHM